MLKTKSDYEKLKEEFNKKVKKLQSECKHESSHWWVESSNMSLFRMTGYKLLVCDNCDKVLARKKQSKEKDALSVSRWRVYKGGIE